MSIPEAFKKSTFKPSSFSLACAAILTALLDELVFSEIITKDAAERVVANARTDLQRVSTVGDFGDALIILREMQHELEATFRRLAG